MLSAANPMSVHWCGLAAQVCDVCVGDCAGDRRVRSEGQGATPAQCGYTARTYSRYSTAGVAIVGFSGWTYR